MNKEFIPYQQALELKELGFDEDVFEWFDTETKDFCDVMKEVKAPLFQQSFRWFREKYNLHPHFFLQPDSTYVWCIRWFEGGRQKDIPYFPSNTYEEAELDCLNKLIEIVKGGKL